MYCKNCGAQVADNATSCPNCQFSFTAADKKEKTLKDFDLSSLKERPVLLAAALAFLFCFFPWVKITAYTESVSISLYAMSTDRMIPGEGILIPALLFLLPVSLMGVVLSEFVAKLEPYRKAFVAGSAILVAYAGLGLYMAVHAAKAALSGNNSYDRIGNVIYEDYSLSIGIGFYLTLIAVSACAYFYYRGLPKDKKTL